MEWVEAKEPCVDCNKTFMRVKKRGRPPIRCGDCFDLVNILKVENATKAVEARINAPKNHGNRPAQLQVDIKLWEGGDVISTRQDLPKGAQAQCVLCWRIFTSDSVCEHHKPYAQPTTTHCKPPASLGMIALDKGGYPVWTIFKEETSDT